MSSSSSKSILVTGGAGYIGSHTCKALSRAGFVPVAYDNLQLGREAAVQYGPLVVGDTRDADAVANAVKSHQAQAVIHFAALSSVGESAERPLAYHTNNVGGLLGVLNGMGQAGCDKIVFSSTAAVYGEVEQTPIPENICTRPVNVYGRSKLMCERILEDVVAAGQLKAVTLRYFNACGADPDGEIGEFRKVETHLIPRALMALQGWVDDFQVFGDDFATPDGTAIRDYIHVSDLAEAHVLALRRLLDGGEGDCFNLGVGHGYSVGEVLKEIEQTTGRRISAPKGGRRTGDPAKLVADVEKARRELGFEASRSSLENIVRTAWGWHQSAHPLRNSN